MRNDSYQTKLEEYARLTEKALEEKTTWGACRQRQVLDAIRYSLLGGGKRLRAAMVLEFGRLCGAPVPAALDLACAVEMVHAYSLIHDDLPCMDNDDYRRGKPSCHKKFGESTALLAGDGLLTLAFETIFSSRVLTSQQKNDAAGILAQASGIFGMIGGQVIDLESEGQKIDMDALNTLYALKTGALLRCAALLGCIAGAPEPEFLEASQIYARKCGLAFQITDDILDVMGEEEKLGKPIGSDRENKKTTYVTLLGLEGAKQSARQQIEQAKESVKEFEENGFLLWVADMILTRDH
ncbi:polyprenyl synthetase family protein [Youxingia wuxianensis]|uniref:Farnesyl diphosphate synthase n=1 Tax=Youxingia wuxianensis TaxID=2763678 RepID=A0A926EMZ9_9FIRM|nr:farnesyl diphosphate synthase [Youxingia wuxianensis]MBC8584207.1 polyprenyl synthetase family protein [Youxingia wuxianensis]